MSMEGEKRYDELLRTVFRLKIQVIPPPPVTICGKCLKGKRWCECSTFKSVKV